MPMLTADDGQVLSVTTMGQGPPLLCLPGGPARAVAYLGDLGGLAAFRTLQLVDPRGTGGSRPVDTATLSLERLVLDVATLITGLDLDKPVVLGHSFGARVALEHAAQHPGTLAALVLVTPPPMMASAELEAARLEILAQRESEPEMADAVEAARGLSTARQRERAMLEAASMPLWYARYDEAARAHLASARDQVALRTALTLRTSAPTWAVPDLAAIDVPVLVVSGALDVLAPPPALHALHDRLSTSTFVTLPESGHFPWLDEPELFTAVVEEFLAELD